MDINSLPSISSILSQIRQSLDFHSFPTSEFLEMDENIDISNLKRVLNLPNEKISNRKRKNESLLENPSKKMCVKVIRVKTTPRNEEYFRVNNVGFILKAPKKVIYSCFVGYCRFKSFDRKKFYQHLLKYHKDTSINQVDCQMCGEVKKDLKSLSHEFFHLISHIEKTNEVKPKKRAALRIESVESLNESKTIKEEEVSVEKVQTKVKEEHQNLNTNDEIFLLNGTILFDQNMAIDEELTPQDNTMIPYSPDIEIIDDSELLTENKKPSKEIENHQKSMKQSSMTTFFKPSIKDELLDQESTSKSKEIETFTFLRPADVMKPKPPIEFKSSARKSTSTKSARKSSNPSRENNSENAKKATFECDKKLKDKLDHILEDISKGFSEKNPKKKDEQEKSSIIKRRESIAVDTRSSRNNDILNPRRASIDGRSSRSGERESRSRNFSENERKTTREGSKLDKVKSKDDQKSKSPENELKSSKSTSIKSSNPETELKSPSPKSSSSKSSKSENELKSTPSKSRSSSSDRRSSSKSRRQSEKGSEVSKTTSSTQKIDSNPDKFQKKLIENPESEDKEIFKVTLTVHTPPLKESNTNTEQIITKIKAEPVDETSVKDNDFTSKLNFQDLSKLYPWIDFKVSSQIVKTKICFESLMTENSLFSTYKCLNQMCSFFTTDFEDFKKHLKNYVDLKHFCNFCLKDFDKSEDLCKHIEESHKYDRFQCNKCMYRACQKGYVEIHQKEFHELDKDCEILKSPVQLFKKNERNAAIKELTLNRKKFVRPLICQVPNCNKAFFSKLNFKTHLRSEVTKLEKHPQPNVTSIICNQLYNIDKANMNYSQQSITQCLFCTYGSDSEVDVVYHLTKKHQSQLAYVCTRKNRPDVSNEKTLGSKETLESYTAVEYVGGCSAEVKIFNGDVEKLKAVKNDVNLKPSRSFVISEVITIED